MISCEWVYGTTLRLIPPLSLGSIFRNLGVGTDHLSDVVTSEMSLKPNLECSTNPYYMYTEVTNPYYMYTGVLHKHIWHHP
jgi:hypothetical protein